MMAEFGISSSAFASFVRSLFVFQPHLPRRYTPLIPDFSPQAFGLPQNAIGVVAVGVGFHAGSPIGLFSNQERASYDPKTYRSEPGSRDGYRHRAHSTAGIPG